MRIYTSFGSIYSLIQRGAIKNGGEIIDTLQTARLGLTADLAHLHVSGVVHGQPHGRISLAASSIDFQPFLKVFRGKDIAAVIENQPWEVMIESRNVPDAFR